ncbi:MAG: ABC transporter permease subunit [Anaerolineales bacterium]|nr:ABC transporter permease subunit [Anaerolineales bacterium]
MTEPILPPPTDAGSNVEGTGEGKLPLTRTGFFARVGKYMLVRLVELGLMLVIGMFAAIVVLNFGGYIDDIYRADIEEALMYMDAPAGMTDAEIVVWFAEIKAAMEHARGLDRPFLLRCLEWLRDALTLQMGNDRVLASHNQSYSTMIRAVILGRLPYTMLLFGVSNLLFFFASLFLALFLYRKYEGFWDRLVVFLSPISSIPSWLYGVFLVILFAAILHVAPFPRRFTLGLGRYLSDIISLIRFGGRTGVGAGVPMILEYMVLPVSAIFLNLFFQSVYNWRTYFLLQSGEDYIDMARAKGLTNPMIERRYLLRPSLPYIITSLAMTMLGIWQNSLILEKFFFWPGIGMLFFDSIRNFQVTGSIIVLFAYLLVITVFLLDIIYAAVDPRVRIGGDENTGGVVRPRRAPGERLRGFFRLRRERKRLPGPQLRPLVMNVDQLHAQRKTSKRARSFSSWGAAFKEIRRYPSAIVGLGIIGLMVFVSIVTVLAIPYEDAVTAWRGDEKIWADNPRLAQPAWVNLFRQDDLPETIVLDSQDGSAIKEVEQITAEMTAITITFPFAYHYTGYPQDLVVEIASTYDEKYPFVALFWVTPDGREIELDTFLPTSSHRYSFDFQYYSGRQNMLEQRSGPLPWGDLFSVPGSDLERVLQGLYAVRLEGFVFEAGADMDAHMVLYGQVYGLAGTDNVRRDLSLALLWGTPFSLAFGLLGALGTGLLAMIIAATGVWFGGWVDKLLQRLTEINMLLPAFPIAIMVYFLYTHNIWIILAVIILLSVFGSAVKNYRSAFMQVKDAGYIEAARVYGVGNWRMIIRYLVPRIIPLLVPQLVALVPSYIFLEPTLAFVGVADPYLPTWGKVLMAGLYVAEENSQIFYMTLMRNPYLALEPLALMFITGLAFSLLGMALDRIFNPRLRSL